MKILVNLLALMLLLSVGACSSEEIISEQSNVYTDAEITEIDAVIGKLQYEESRTAVTMGDFSNNSIKLVWAEKDTIGIYPTEGDQLSFPIVDGVGTNLCTFNGGGWALKTSTSYKAYSPFNRIYYLKESNKLPVSMLGQKQVGNGNSDHLGKYDLQIAEGKTPTSGKISFEFKHQVCFIRMDLTAPIAATWKSISLVSDALFNTEATINLVSNPSSLEYKSPSNSITLELENVTTTSESPTITAYMVVLPVDLRGKSLDVKLTDTDGNTYTSEAIIANDYRNFKAGFARWIKADMLPPNNQIWYTSSDGEIIIPKYCPEYSYETFGANMLDNSYKNGKGIITFDNDVTKIGDATLIDNYAFSDCSTLTSIMIPSSVTTIGTFSFENCTSLTSITIPKNVTIINGSFFNNSSLLSIVVEQGNSVYDSRDNCNAIIETATNTLVVGCKNTIIPNSVTIIGTSAFAGCNSLISMTIPNGVTSIKFNAFGSCSSLESVEIPNSVTSIMNTAFGNCSSLAKIDVKALVPPQIAAGTFPDNSEIKVYVPAESIDDYKAAEYWKDLNILSAE